MKLDQVALVYAFEPVSPDPGCATAVENDSGARLLCRVWGLNSQPSSRATEPGFAWNIDAIEI